MKTITEKVKPIKEWLSATEKEMCNRGGTPDLPITSLPEFNKMIWGFKRGSLVIVGARTSQGKTSLSTQLAYDFANNGHPVLFISLETMVIGLIERIFSQQTKVDNFDLIRGALNYNSTIKLLWEEFKKKIYDMKLLITSGIGRTFDEINHVIELLDPKPHAVFIDYIQNIKMSKKDSRESINEYIRNFRQLALDHNFCGILCSQINRMTEGHGREPSLWGLKESGFLEESADLVLLLHWKNFYDHGLKDCDYKIMIAKNRNGKTGDFPVEYIPQNYSFVEKGE